MNINMILNEIKSSCSKTERLDKERKYRMKEILQGEVENTPGYTKIGNNYFMMSRAESFKFYESC